MGLPKNFHQQHNLPKMYEALNSLNFYDFEYKVVLSEGYNKKLREAEILGHFIDSDLNVITRIGDLEFTCIKSFSATDDETANVKINEWLSGKIEINQITEYEILKFSSNSLEEKLEIMGLDKII